MIIKSFLIIWELIDCNKRIVGKGKNAMKKSIEHEVKLETNDPVKGSIINA